MQLVLPIEASISNTVIEIDRRSIAYTLSESWRSHVSVPQCRPMLQHGIWSTYSRLRGTRYPSELPQVLQLMI